METSNHINYKEERVIYRLIVSYFKTNKRLFFTLQFVYSFQTS